MKKILFTFLFVALMFIGCSTENINTNIYPIFPYVGYYQPYSSNSNGQFVIGGYVNGSRITRAEAYEIDGYTNFALYCWTSDSVVMGPGCYNASTDGYYHGVFTNNMWGYTEDLKYFNNDEDSYNFIGIIPQENIQEYSNQTVTVQAEDFKVDNKEINNYYDNNELLIARTTVAANSYSQGATLNFEHQNAIIKLQFKTTDNKELEIIDYYTDNNAYDVYEVSGKPFPVVGVKLTEIEISDEDIEYINSRYQSSLGWISYYSNSTVIDGDLQANMITYLKTKYGNSVIGSNWTNYANNENMRLVHIDKSGHTAADNDSYRAWFINIQNMQFTQTSSGSSASVPGIVILPATSENQTGKDAILSTFPQNVSATISLDNIAWSQNTSINTLTFTKPSGVITTSKESPTNWYTFPAIANTNYGENFGFTIKFSYIFDGITKYDARVYIPAADCNWQAGKYYTYIIKLKNNKPGHINPNNPEADDPVIEVEFPIQGNYGIDTYTDSGETHEYEL